MADEKKPEPEETKDEAKDEAEDKPKEATELSEEELEEVTGGATASTQPVELSTPRNHLRNLALKKGKVAR